MAVVVEALEAVRAAAAPVAALRTPRNGPRWQHSRGCTEGTTTGRAEEPGWRRSAARTDCRRLHTQDCRSRRSKGPHQQGGRG